MSRTRKGTKAPGYEYWVKRPGGAMPPGRISKKITHKADHNSHVNPKLSWGPSWNESDDFSYA